MEQKIFEVLSKLTVKIDKLDSDIQGMKQEQQEMKADIQGMKQEQQEMKADIQGMKQEQQEMKADIQGMKQEQQEMKTDIQGIKQEQQEMKVDIQGIKQELQTFRQNTEQNFTTIINYSREIQKEIQALNEKTDKELAHLELKSDVLQGEVIRIKQRQYVSP